MDSATETRRRELESEIARLTHAANQDWLDGFDATAFDLERSIVGLRREWAVAMRHEGEELQRLIATRPE